MRIRLDLDAQAHSVAPDSTSAGTQIPNLLSMDSRVITTSSSDNSLSLPFRLAPSVPLNPQP